MYSSDEIRWKSNKNYIKTYSFTLCTAIFIWNVLNFVFEHEKKLIYFWYFLIYSKISTFIPKTHEALIQRSHE